MHFNLLRRLPLSIFLGLTIASVGVAAPLGHHESPDDRLILIAESTLHGIPASQPGTSLQRTPPQSTQHDTSTAAEKNLAQDDASLPSTDSGSGPATSKSGRVTPGGRTVESAERVALTRRDPRHAARGFGALATVPAHELDDMRGGFDTSLNLTLSFGIERAVYLNGALVTTTSFNLPALGGLPRDDTSGTAFARGSVALVQNGPGNTFAQPRDSTPLAATVIQNTLDNQSLQSLTTINASSNSLHILRANAFQSLVQEGIGRVIVPH